MEIHDFYNRYASPLFFWANDFVNTITDTYHNSQVLHLQSWSDTLRTLQIAKPPAFSFVAGQYCKIALEVHGKFVMRPFSIASPPHAHYMEFVISTVKNGMLSPSLHARTVGQSLWVEKKAHGFFVLSEIPPVEHLWLIATGSGISPFLSILQDNHVFQQHTRVILVHGVRFDTELVHKKMLQNLVTTHKNFDYLTLTSQPDTHQVHPHTDGCATNVVTPSLYGRVTQALDDERIESLLGIQISPAHNHFMLCGNPHMVDEVIQILGRYGCTRHRRRKPGHISVEKFW